MKKRTYIIFVALLVTAIGATLFFAHPNLCRATMTIGGVLNQEVYYECNQMYNIQPATWEMNT